MKLADWLALPNADGSRKRRRDFAAQIGVSPTAITEYCEGTYQPSTETMENIVRETGGAVTANDFMSDEARRLIAEAAQ